MRSWVKVWAIARVAVRHVLQEPWSLAGRVVLLGIFLGVFTQLWEAVLERESVLGSPSDMVWYLVLTEWVVLALPPLHQYIERDVRSGEVAYHLTRPLSYVGLKLAEAVGEAAVRFVCLGVSGVAWAYYFTETWPSDPLGFVAAVPLVAVGILMGLVCMASMGLAAFWIQDCSSLYWVWQKSAFVLGGLMLPFQIYPDWLRSLSEHSPFAAMLYGPASQVFTNSPKGAMAVAVQQGIWMALFVAILVFLQWRSVRAVEINGG